MTARAAVVLLALLAASPLAAQLRADRPTLNAVRASAPIRVDGRITEGEWGAAPVGSGFVQRTPDPGAAPTQPTEIRVQYDDDALYLAARMFDSHPDSIAAPLARRDPTIPYSDWINVLVDSYDDHRTAFHFGVNPRGVTRDIYHSSEDSEDSGWDAVWDVATQVDSLGWTAEFRIPFSQLRFRPGASQEWGLNVYRRLSRRDEYSHWAPFLPSDPSFIAGFGRLRGIEGIQPPRRVEIQPYLSAKLARAPSPAGDPFDGGNGAASSAGVDLRAGLPLGLNLAATLNPDFGQVEVDPAVINLTAFETLYPERRPFFVEGSGIFQFGQLRAYSGSSGSVVHTRRIGRAPQGFVGGDFVDAPDQSTILGAAKVSGQLPGGWSLGVMDALTDRERARFSGAEGIGETLVEPRTNYFAGRARRDWSGGGSFLGAILTATNRQLSGDLERQLRSGAYLAGADGAWSWDDRRWTLSGYLVGSRVTGSESSIASTQLSSARYFARPDATHLELDPGRTALGGHDGGVALAKGGGSWSGSLRYDETSPGFEPNDLGFRTRADSRWLSGTLTTRRDTPGRWTRSASLTLSNASAWNFGGDQFFQETALRGFAALASYWEVGGRVGYAPRVTQDRLTRGGPLAVRAEQWSASASIGSDTRRALYGDLNVSHSRSELGDFASMVHASATYRPTDAVEVMVAPLYSRQRDQRQYVKSVADPLAAATFGRRYVFARLDQSTLSLETRVSWTFTPRLSLQLFMQPLLNGADFSDYKEMSAPRAVTLPVYGRDQGSVEALASGLLRVDPDGTGSAQPFLLGDGFRQLDFNVQSLRGNAVLRWEFRPGSALFFVWQQERAGEDRLADLAPGRDLDALLARPARNVFLVKGSWWIGV